MSLEALDEALCLLERDPGGADFAGAQSRWAVEDAEVPLGFRFPPSYREFLIRLGRGRYRGDEFFGMAGDDADVVTRTQAGRRDLGLPWEYLLVAPRGEGGYLVLDLGRVDAEGETPVVAWHAEDGPGLVVAGSFGEFFLAVVRAGAPVG